MRRFRRYYLKGWHSCSGDVCWLIVVLAVAAAPLDRIRFHLLSNDKLIRWYGLQWWCEEHSCTALFQVPMKIFELIFHGAFCRPVAQKSVVQYYDDVVWVMQRGGIYFYCEGISQLKQLPLSLCRGDVTLRTHALMAGPAPEEPVSRRLYTLLGTGERTVMCFLFLINLAEVHGLIAEMMLLECHMILPPLSPEIAVCQTLWRVPPYCVCGDRCGHGCVHCSLSCTFYFERKALMLMSDEYDDMIFVFIKFGICCTAWACYKRIFVGDQVGGVVLLLICFVTNCFVSSHVECLFLMFVCVVALPSACF